MSKPQKSKLDPHAESLLSLELEGKTLPEMIQWLRGEGVTVAASTLSVYLSALRDSRREQSLLAQITTGARQSKEVKAAFEKNPAPELDTLIKLVRVLIMQLSTGGVDNPEMLKLADQLTNTVLNFITGQTKAAHKEREVTLAEQKAIEAKKEDGAKALEYALEESKGTPAEELFRQAFAALKKAKGVK
jgi:hypothetical protein